MDWSRAGRFILFAQLDAKTKWDLWVLPLAGDRKPVPVVRTEFNEGDGQFSADAKWIAYWSDESGRWEVYVRSFPEGGGVTAGKWQVSMKLSLPAGDIACVLRMNLVISVASLPPFAPATELAYAGPALY